MNIWDRVLSRPHDNYLIMTHFPRYDIDGVTSAIVIAAMLKMLGIDKVSLYFPFADRFNRLLERIPCAKDILVNINCYYDETLSIEQLTDVLYYVDSLIVVDRYSPDSLMSRRHPQYQSFSEIINKLVDLQNLIVIDHRDISNVPNYVKEFSTYYIDPKAPATAAIVYKLIREILAFIQQEEITPEIGDIFDKLYFLLYAGMINDSLMLTSCNWTPEYTKCLAEIEMHLRDKYNLSDVKRLSYMSKPDGYYEIVPFIRNRVLEVEEGLYVAFISFYDFYSTDTYINEFEEAIYYAMQEFSNTYLYLKNANMFALVVEMPNSVFLAYNCKCDCNITTLNQRLGANGRYWYGYTAYQDSPDNVIEKLRRAYVETFIAPMLLQEI